MATTLLNFEGGTAGLAATPTNTTCAQASAGTGGSLTFDATAALSGALGIKGVTGTAAISYLEVQGSGTAIAAIGATTFVAATTEEMRIPFFIDTLGPANANSTVIQVYGAAGATLITTTVFRVRIDATTGALTVTDNASVHTGTAIADIRAYFNTYVTFHFTLNAGTTTSDGSVSIKMFDAAGAQVGSTFTATNYSLGAGTPFTAMHVGILTGPPSAVRQWRTDYVQIKDASTTFSLTGPAAPSAPTAAAGADQYPAVGTTVALNASGSTAGSGSITGWLWTIAEYPGATPPALSTPTASTCNVTGLVAGVTKINLVVTQTGGTSSTADQMIIWTHPTGTNPVQVYSVDGTTTFSNDGGAASLLAALNDTNSATRGISPTNPAAATDFIAGTMCPYGDGTVAITPSAFWATAATTLRGQIWKEDGTTVLLDTTVNLTNTEAPTPFTLAAGAMTTLGTAYVDRRALKFKFSTDTV